MKSQQGMVILLVVKITVKSWELQAGFLFLDQKLDFFTLSQVSNIQNWTLIRL